MKFPYLLPLPLSLCLCTILGHSMCYERILPTVHAAFHLKLENHNIFALLISITYKILLLCMLMVPHLFKRSAMSFGQLLHGHVLQGSVKAEFMIVLMHHSTPIPHLESSKNSHRLCLLPVPKNSTLLKWTLNTPLATRRLNKIHYSIFDG